MDNIYDILKHMQKRTAMFLGNDYTFETLNGFITGYTFAARADQLQKQGCPDFTYFNTWILGHLEKHYGLAGGWHWQIHNRNLNDDKKAFEEFFYYLDIFKKSETTNSQVIVKDKSAYNYEGKIRRSWLAKEDGTAKEVPIDRPFAVNWITMTNSTIVWLNYLDSNGNSLFEHWYITKTEAKRSLKLEFGEFKLD